MGSGPRDQQGKGDAHRTHICAGAAQRAGPGQVSVRVWGAERSPDGGYRPCVRQAVHVVADLLHHGTYSRTCAAVDTAQYIPPFAGQYFRPAVVNHNETPL